MMQAKPKSTSDDDIHDANSDISKEARNRTLKAYLLDVQPNTAEPANINVPAFVVGPHPEFEGISAGALNPKSGNMSEGAYEQLKDTFVKMDQAKLEPPEFQRQANRAATLITKDFSDQFSKHGVVSEVKHQVAMDVRAIAKAAGVSELASDGIAVGVTQALSAKGFSTLLEQGYDKGVKLGTKVSEIALSIGKKELNESALGNLAEKTGKWLADHGVTHDAIKETLGKHAGKFSALAEMAQHPEAFQRAAQLIANSDKAIDAFVAIKNDKELRFHMGNTLLAAGDASLEIPGLKAVGTLERLAGAVMANSSDKGEHHDVTREIVRSGFVVAGGAAGAVAGAGWLSVGTGAIGAELGRAAADYILGPEPSTKSIDTAQAAESKQFLANKGMDVAKDLTHKGVEAATHAHAGKSGHSSSEAPPPPEGASAEKPIGLKLPGSPEAGIERQMTRAMGR